MKDDNVEHPSLLTSIEHIWTYSLGIFRDIYALFKLEVKLAGRSLAIMLIAMILAALLLISCWFCLLGSMVVWLVSLNYGILSSLLILSALNLIIAIVIVFYIIKISGNLHFKETRKQLELGGNHEQAK